jgi:hypothetical protein
MYFNAVSQRFLQGGKNTLRQLVSMVVHKSENQSGALCN